MEQLAQPGVGGVGRVGRHLPQQQGRQGLDALAQVGAGGLAGLVPVAGDVEHVVGQLERDTDPLAEGAEDVDHPRLGAGGQCSYPAGDGDQRSGLAGQHAQVVVERVVVRAGAGGLQDLAGDQPLERVGLQPDGLRAEVGQHLGGTGEEEVAGQDGDRVVPARVGAGRAASHRGLVHDVVVVERGEVGELDHDGGRDHAGRTGVAELGGQQHQQRTEALPARGHQMAGGDGDEGDVALDGLGERDLHRFHPGLDVTGQIAVLHAEPKGSHDGHEDHSSVPGRSSGPVPECRRWPYRQGIRSRVDHCTGVRLCHARGVPAGQRGYPNEASGPRAGRDPDGRRSSRTGPPPGHSAGPSADGQPTKNTAFEARSRKYCGSSPSPIVTSTPIPIAVAVKALGTATVGPPGCGSEKNISTMTLM